MKTARHFGLPQANHEQAARDCITAAYLPPLRLADLDEPRAGRPSPMPWGLRLLLVAGGGLLWAAFGALVASL